MKKNGDPFQKKKKNQNMTIVRDQIKYKDHSANSTKSIFEELLPALKRLDDLLKKAVDAAQTIHGSRTAADSFRGLYISESEVENLLNHEPGDLSLNSVGKQFDESVSELVGNDSRMSLLQQAFKLSPFELDLILIALASEIDLRYEKLYAYLQDDVTRKRPTVDLALNLLCAKPEEKLTRRDHFASDAPLIQQGLVHLIPDPNHVQPPLLSYYLKLDEQIVRLLLGQDGLDRRLSSFCKILESDVSFHDLPLDEEIKQALPALVNQAWEERQPLRLYFQGPGGAGKRRAAEALATETGVPLLAANFLRISDSKTDFDYALKLLFREVWFQDAILFLDGVDAFFTHDRDNQHNLLLDALAADAGITILAGVKPWVPLGSLPTGVLTIQFDIPDLTRRRDCWEAKSKEAGFTLNGLNLDVLAGRFRLTPGQIAEAVALASNHARWRTAGKLADHSPSHANGQPTIGDLFTAAREQSGHDLATLARKIEPIYTWDDIVLPEDTMAQLREICQWVTHRHRVLGEWGFNRKLSMGKGVTALFAGPSGTGKTMAAEIIANEREGLGLELYKIDLAGVVSKYIGETEKNLDRIFTAAENANAIIFFDEADALFGKRSEVRDSHDRYANIEVSYLLQKMEEYDGITILATNLRQNLDESFLRRLAFTVHFPFPDEVSRRRIWAGIWPTEVPLANDVDLDFPAHQFKLSGGNIKNIALAAAFLAAADGGSVMMEHVLQATRREYQKMGKFLTDAELKGMENNTRN